MGRPGLKLPEFERAVGLQVEAAIAAAVPDAAAPAKQ